MTDNYIPSARDILKALIGEPPNPEVAKMLSDRVAPQESGHRPSAKELIEAALALHADTQAADSRRE